MKTDDNSDDAKLIRQILAGDQTASTALRNRYELRLHAYIFNLIRKRHSREDAEEIVQDAFLKILKHLETLKAPEKLFGWMCSISDQCCVLWLRKHGKHLEYLSFDDGIQGQELHAEASLDAYQAARQQAEEGELLGIVSGAIDMLPDLDRRVMRCAESGMSYQQIADELELTEAAVKHRLHRARRKVKELVDRMEEDNRH